MKNKILNNEHLKQVDNRMIEVLSDCPPVMKPMMNHLKKSKGKNIRAAIIMAIYDACENYREDLYENIINFAASVEILHLSTLIHDDIIDDAKIRRGMETLQLKFGKKQAVLCGDYLFTKCFSLISDKNKNRVEDFSKAISAICIGEITQYQNNYNFNITEKEYYKIISGKTAALFSMCMYGAAIESEATSVIAERLARAGYYLGMVFQMVDDWLDYTGETKKTNKSVKKDLEQGIITYPLIKTIEIQPSIKKLLKKDMSNEDINKIVDAVQTSGGIEQSKLQAELYYNRAKKKIHKAFDTDKKNSLLQILDFVYYRDH